MEEQKHTTDDGAMGPTEGDRDAVRPQCWADFEEVGLRLKGHKLGTSRWR